MTTPTFTELFQRLAKGEFRAMTEADWRSYAGASAHTLFLELGSRHVLFDAETGTFQLIDYAEEYAGTPNQAKCWDIRADGVEELF